MSGDPSAKGPSDKYRRARELGLLTAIPMLLAVSPLVGFYLGRWIDARFRTEPVFQLVFLALGLAAGVRETVLIIRKAQRPDED